jgi:diadenosine tetraphosphate (Ap4A) HIT family hydrolase
VTASGLHNEYKCRTCGFALWRPVLVLGVSSVGLYDDARFPGRSLVSLHEHYDSITEVPTTTLAAFAVDVQRVCVSVLKVAAADRVNVAILGNRDPHVHAHVIPRFSGEPEPYETIWQDARPQRNLEDGRADDLILALASELATS